MVPGRLVLLLFGLLAASAAWGKSLAGRIVGVSDGDTVTLLTAAKEQYKIRLYGIDAPESHQAFGQASKKALSDLVFNREVEVDVKARDRYGRTVGVVFVDGVNINESQVAQGMAWWYRSYAKGEKALARLEQEARKAKRGLWQEPDPTPPWEFRRKARAKS